MSDSNGQTILEVLERLRGRFFGKYRGSVTDVDADTGAGVWIEFEGGDVSYPIWTGCYWRAGEQPSDAAPKVKTIVTAAGHKILLDDDAGSVTVTDSNDNKVTLDSSGVTIERGGSKIEVNDSEVNVNDGALEVT